MTTPSLRFAVIGLGNDYRGDDAAGLVTLGLIRKELEGTNLESSVVCLENRGDPAALIAELSDLEGAIIIDAAKSNDSAGTIKRFEPLKTPLNESASGTNLHNFSLTQTLELAFSLDLSLKEITVYGISGANFQVGDELGPEVWKAASEVAHLAIRELQSWAKT